jgi:hypothetical protein
MPKLKTYSEFVNEALIDAIKNPIKWKKIKNNAKKYQKAKVAQALNDVDNAKRLEKGSDTLSAKQKEVLTQANKAKNSALADTTTNIGQRMADLATTDGLKQVVKLAKTKSALAANQIVLKAADGEEAKRLKIKQTKLTGKATDAQKALADYESEGNDKPADDSALPTPTKTEKPPKTGKTPPPLPAEDKAAKEAAEAGVTKAKAAYDAVKDGDDEKTKLQAEIKFKQAQQKKAKLDGNDELFQGLGNDIGEIMKNMPKDDPTAKIEADIKAFNDNIEAERTTMNKATTDLEQAQRDLKTGRGSEEKVQKLQKAIEDSKEDIAELKKQETEAKKKLAALVPESFEYVAESIDEGMYTASQLTGMLIDDIRKGIRKGIQAPDAKELKELALKRLKMKRVNKVDIEDTINGWEKSLADARKDKMREEMFSFVKATKGKIPESFEYVAESVSQKFARLRSNL